ncbi:MAG: PAS domain S-box protein [Deltaproteobacteria bacterium]|nr:PAS domain S-box protein [Deltaproteobacteria bacterium]
MSDNQIIDDLENRINEITKQRDQALTELEHFRELEKKLNMLFKHVPDVVWIVSLTDMSTVFITSSIYNMIGYTPEEISHIPHKKLITEESYDHIATYLNNVLARVEKGLESPTAVHRLTIDYRHKNGSIVPAEIIARGYIGENGRLVQVIGISKDISQRQKAERFLEISEARYKNIVETSPNAIYITSFDGRFVDANPAAVSLFGCKSRAELSEHLITEFYENPEQRTAFQDEMRHNSFVKDYPVKFKKLDGTIMDCGLTSILRRSDDGQVIGYQGIIRDMTEENRLRSQLVQAQKMEAIATLAGGIAHNFNNILMTIQGNTSLLLMKTDPADPAFRKLEKIEEYIRYGSELSNQLLGFFRGGTTKKSSTNINRLLANSVKMFSRSRKEVDIKTMFAKNAWPVIVDKGQIEQIMMNLFVNARQAMPDGGQIVVQTQNLAITHAQATAMDIPCCNYLKISVADTGTGMDRKTAEKIFDPFFTTKKPGEGTGLGLSTAYGIIKNHGGHIDVYSEPGKGTIFHILLPASENTPEKAKRKAPDRLLTGTETILIIDDEEIIRETGCGMLEELGYKVMPAESGDRGLAILSEEKENIDLVILDMIMPEMNGTRTYEHIRALTPGMKVLLSSGYPKNGQAAEILAAGCNGFIQKPFNLSELSVKVREMIESA